MENYVNVYLDSDKINKKGNKGYVMKFNVAIVNLSHGQRLFDLKRNKQISDDLILSNEFFEDNKKLIVKVNRENNSAKYGSLTDTGEIKQLNDVTGRKVIYELKFVIVDLIKNAVYFDCSFNMVKQVLHAFFKVAENLELNQIVSIDEIKNLERLSVKTKDSNQLNLFDDEFEKETSSSILNIFSKSAIEEKEISFKLKRDAFFHKKSLSKFVDDCSNKGNIVFIKGMGMNGEDVVYCPEGKFKKSIDLEISEIEYNDRKKLTEQIIYQKMEGKW